MEHALLFTSVMQPDITGTIIKTTIMEITIMEITIMEITMI